MPFRDAFRSLSVRSRPRRAAWLCRAAAAGGLAAAAAGLAAFMMCAIPWQVVRSAEPCCCCVSATWSSCAETAARDGSDSPVGAPKCPGRPGALVGAVRVGRAAAGGAAKVGADSGAPGSPVIACRGVIRGGCTEAPGPAPRSGVANARDDAARAACDRRADSTSRAYATARSHPKNTCVRPPDGPYPVVAASASA